MKENEIDYKSLYEQEHKKYGDAVERMKSWMNGDHPECFSEAHKAAEFVFSELAESEDEKMINFITNELMCLRAIESSGGGKGSDRYKEITNAIAWIEKQGKIIDEYEDKLDRCACKSFDKGYKAALEKQGEQTPGDKPEPKFKVGDWILIDNPCKIISIDNYGNYLVRYWDFDAIDKLHTLSKEFCETYFHLWTIQDAKEGDVLADDYSMFIFRKIGNESWSDVVDYYVGWNYKIKSEIKVQSGKSHYGIIDNVDFKPATKEQCDLLFTKMKEDGYEWDAEDKVLKKIEPKQELSEDAATNEYINLGLPSGTLWKPFNEDGYYKFDEAVEKFGDLLPTKEQWEELKDECKWVWKDNGYDVIGPNGNLIFLPAVGYRVDMGVYDVGMSSAYWSLTDEDEDYAWDMYFDKNDLDMYEGLRYYGRSVRLVK